MVCASRGQLVFSAHRFGIILQPQAQSSRVIQSVRQVEPVATDRTGEDDKVRCVFRRSRCDLAQIWLAQSRREKTKRHPSNGMNRLPSTVHQDTALRMFIRGTESFTDAIEVRQDNVSSRYVLEELEYQIVADYVYQIAILATSQEIRALERL